MYGFPPAVVLDSLMTHRARCKRTTWIASSSLRPAVAATAIRMPFPPWTMMMTCACRIWPYRRNRGKFPLTDHTSRPQYKAHCNHSKRFFRVHPEEEADNTRDSVLSDTSQTFCDNFGDPELMIIDFEYCAYNYRGFDVANHFVEWTIDYRVDESPYYSLLPENFPNRDQQVGDYSTMSIG